MSYPEAIEWYHKGTKYHDSKKFEKGVAALKKSLGIWEFKESWINLGNCYKGMGEDQLACDAYTKAMDASMPDAHMKFWAKYPLALINMGLMAYRYGHDDIAIEYYNAALGSDYKDNRPDAAKTY